MSNENQSSVVNLNRTIYRISYITAGIIIAIAIILFFLIPFFYKTILLVYEIFFCSTLLLLIGSLLAFLFFTLHKQQQMEQLYLNWQITKWKEELENEKIRIRQGNVAERQKTENLQQQMNYFIRLMELSKGEEKLTKKITKEEDKAAKLTEETITEKKTVESPAIESLLTGLQKFINNQKQNNL